MLFSSVVSIKKIRVGQKFNLKNLWVKRPGTGDFLANKLNFLIGKKLKKNISKNQFIKKEHV